MPQPERSKWVTELGWNRGPGLRRREKMHLCPLISEIQRNTWIWILIDFPSIVRSPASTHPPTNTPFPAGQPKEGSQEEELQELGDADPETTEQLPRSLHLPRIRSRRHPAPLHRRRRLHRLQREPRTPRKPPLQPAPAAQPVRASAAGRRKHHRRLRHVRAWIASFEGAD